MQYRAHKLMNNTHREAGGGLDRLCVEPMWQIKRVDLSHIVEERDRATEEETDSLAKSAQICYYEYHRYSSGNGQITQRQAPKTSTPAPLPMLEYLRVVSIIMARYQGKTVAAKSNQIISTFVPPGHKTYLYINGEAATVKALCTPTKTSSPPSDANDGLDRLRMKSVTQHS